MSSTHRPVRVAIYARVSTSQGQDPGMQVAELRQVAEQREWQVTGLYVDVGQSGAKDRRPELDRLLHDAKRGRIDLVAVWRLDRLGRSLKHLLTLLEEFRAMNVDFYSLRDPVDTSTPAGRLSMSIIAAMAEFERELIRERVRSGLEAARRRGTTLGRPRVHVDVDLARRMKREGHTMSEIAKACGAGVSTVRREPAKAAERDRASAA